jgi:hypothetical protein
MLGRALFALVWLIIAAGVLLPLYPADVPAPGPAGGEVAAALADVMDTGCGPCAPDAASGANCGRKTGGGIAAAPAALAACSRLKIHLVVQPEPPDRAPEPAAPLPRLPEV